WLQEGIIVTPAARQKYDKQNTCIGQYFVQHASDEIAYVWNAASIPRLRRRVNKALPDCTCPYMDQFGIPCRHVIAALNACGMTENLNSSFNTCYTVATYDAAFRNKYVLIPLESEIDS
ncbi:unnamed protein product, partial [Aphanomyces euteiches]